VGEGALGPFPFFMPRQKLLFCGGRPGGKGQPRPRRESLCCRPRYFPDSFYLLTGSENAALSSSRAILSGSGIAFHDVLQVEKAFCVHEGKVNGGFYRIGADDAAMEVAWMGLPRFAE